MATTQRIVWTVLPNGVNPDTNRLRFSAVASPRLKLDPTTDPRNLSSFPDWQDWPAIIENATFDISINNGATIRAERVSAVRSDVWRAIFPEDTFVRPWNFEDLRNRVLMTYPVSRLANVIETLYGALAVSANDGLPTRREIATLVNDLGVINGFTSAIDVAGSGTANFFPQYQPREPDEILNRLREEKKGDRQSDSILRTPGYELDLLAAFHRPLQREETVDGAEKYPADDLRRNAKWKTYRRAALPSPEEIEDEFDFHQIVASLNQHTMLSRLCGLIIELEAPADAAPSGQVKLQMKVARPSAAGPATNEPDILPISTAVRAGSRFEMRASSNLVTGRYMRLQDSPFRLVQLDVDGGGLKVRNFLTNLARAQPLRFDDETGADDDPEAGAPSQRTAGLMLAHEDRDFALSSIFDRSAQLESAVAGGGSPPDLFAEDVLRGYRVDIRDDDENIWRSLNFRRTEHSLRNTGATIVADREESISRVAAGESADDANTDILKVHEGLFSWKGWSLAAPEPGRIIDKNDEVGDQNEQTPGGLPVSTNYKATPGALPRLRFGKRYSVRLRLVDLAGASADFSESDVQPNLAKSNSEAYLRWEPVEAPTIAIAKTDTGAETPADGESLLIAATRTFNDVDNSVAAEAPVRRVVLPPRVGHRFAEQHGVMDTANGGKINPQLFTMLATLDQPLEQITAALPGLPGPVPTPENPPPPPPVPSPLPIIAPDASLPYLPDPLAVGVAIKIRGVAGVDPTEVFRVPFYGNAIASEIPEAWPKAETFTIVAGEFGAPGAEFRKNSREFRINLEKGERAKVEISCLMPKRTSREVMAVIALLRSKEKSPQSLASQLRRVDEGRHWMTTPWRTLEFVHAVQRPLIIPDLMGIEAQRTDVGETSGRLKRADIPLSANTNARIDLKANWVEPVDDPEAPAPAFRDHAAAPYGAATIRSEMLNNKYPALIYDAVDPVRKKVFHEFGDTRYRRVSYRMEGTTRHREFMPPDIRADIDKMKIVSPDATAWVKNAAPPAQPEILYVVPTFGWTRGEQNNRKSSFRSGGGLRVYMNRPWFASGFTEMMGVVLPPSASPIAVAAPNPDLVYKDSITMWGSDPIWNDAKVTSVSPAPDAFPLARWRAPITFDGAGFPEIEGVDLPAGDFPVANLAHPDGGAPRLNVAPHSVGYDTERQLYYCDIVVRAPARTYFPFIRLALARYNPISVDGAHLSDIVLTEFVQLTPDRFVVVTRKSGGTKADISVYGPLPENAANLAASGAGAFTAEAQTLSANGDPDLDWRTINNPFIPGLQQLSLSPQEAASPNLSARRAVTPPARSEPRVSDRTRREFDRLIAEERFREIIIRPDLLALWNRPLIWQGEIDLPRRPPGGRRRVMITERERYRARERNAPNPNRWGERIVFMEAIEI